MVKYSLQVCEDYAIIKGWMTYECLMALVEICKKQGYTHITNLEDGSQGFKLVKKNDN